MDLDVDIDVDLNDVAVNVDADVGGRERQFSRFYWDYEYTAAWIYCTCSTIEVSFTLDMQRAASLCAF